MRAAVLASFVLLLGCDDKKSAAPPPERRREALVNAGLASSDGGMTESAKASLVAQQCSIACTLHPENEGCTQTCAKQCLTATDIPAIDACARGVASQK
jgi:hypothetical protein